MSPNFISDLISTIISFFVFLLLVFFIVITLAVRYRKRKKENELMRVSFAEQLLQSQLEIREQTLQHVSRELHDNLGQVASLIKINLNTIQVHKPEPAAMKLANTKDLVKQMIMDIKLLSTSLNGDKVNKIGLMKAMENEVEKINKTGVFTSRFTQHDNIPPINDEKSIIIFRMVQEILNNALKHAEAKEITIDAYYQKNTFILTIKDDGKGFDVAAKLADINDQGNGLINLEKRARVINADIKFNSWPGKGSETIISTAL